MKHGAICFGVMLDFHEIGELVNGTLGQPHMTKYLEKHAKLTKLQHSICILHNSKVVFLPFDTKSKENNIGFRLKDIGVSN